MNTKYREYLKSSDWQQKRRQKLTRRQGSKRRCAICAATEHLDIHHLSYRKDLTAVRQCELRVLCRTCHDCAHELMKRGTLTFTSRNHHHRFTLTKTAVKKALGLGDEFQKRADESNALKAISKELAELDARYRAAVRES